MGRETKCSMSITRMTHDYIAKHPSVEESLRRGIVNYSALAREIAVHYSIEQIDAVAIACRRYANRNRLQDSPRIDAVELLRRARLKVRTRLAMATIATPTDWRVVPQLREVLQLRHFHLTSLEGDSNTTLITECEAMPVLEATLRGQVAIKQSSEKIAQLVLTLDTTSTAIDTFMSYIFSLLRHAQVRILEASASSDELMVLIPEAELPASLATLNSQ